MKLEHIKSATVMVHANGVKILNDPWLVDGEYYGSWLHYPHYDFDPSRFDDVDYIYISHIHPDHISKKTMALLNKDIPVLIHTYESKFLKRNIEMLGFTVKEMPHNERVELKNGIFMNILAADNCNPEVCAKFFGCGIVETQYGSTQIDTLCVIDDGEHVLVNVNDCPYDLSVEAVEEIKNKYDHVDLLLCGFGGAGPYPQCFSSLTKDELKNAIEWKKNHFFSQGESFISQLKPRYYMPFAGNYILASHLASLTFSRGVPELEEARDRYTHSEKIDPSISSCVLLNTHEFFDLDTKKQSAPYTEVDLDDKHDYVANIASKKKLDYEDDSIPSLDELENLLPLAYKRMEERRKFIDFNSKTNAYIILNDAISFKISMSGHGYETIKTQSIKEDPQYVSLKVDSRLLIQILKGPKYAHWNNAEIGSHIEYQRKPNIFERGLYHVMCYFHV